jgi:hypothetical protein
MENKSLRPNDFVYDEYVTYYNEKWFPYLWIVMVVVMW